MVTVAVVAAALGVTPARVGQYIAAGRIPARKVGKSWVIPDDWRLLSRSEVPAEPPPPEFDSPPPHPDGLVGAPTSWDAWVSQQRSAADARLFAQAADIYWRAQERARLEQIAQGRVCDISVLQIMADDTLESIESVMGPSLVVAWAGASIGEREIVALMEHLREDLVARWRAHGIDVVDE